MNWNAIGAVGQILGSLATFITVGYLAVQLHDSELETQRLISQSRLERAMQINLALASDERLAAIQVKGTTALLGDQPIGGYAAAAVKLGLTLEEAVLLNRSLQAQWNSFTQTILYADKLLPGDRIQFDRNLRGYFSDPLVRFWWGFVKDGFNPDVVRYIENALAQPG